MKYPKQNLNEGYWLEFYVCDSTSLAIVYTMETKIIRFEVFHIPRLRYTYEKRSTDELDHLRIVRTNLSIIEHVSNFIERRGGGHV